MDHREAHKRLIAAQALLMEPTTTREKISHVFTLLRGAHPSIDSMLHECEKHLSLFDKMASGDVIGLSADHLPENTEEEKKRKKALLLFIGSWRNLKSEVARVQAEFNQNPQSGVDQASMWGRIFRGAKGPLGIVTVIAIGVVALQQTSVEVTIQNKGCGTMQPSGVPISIPGFKLPQDPIPNGGSAILTIPPFALNVDGTQKGTLSLSALTFSFGFELGSNIADVTLDGVSLLGKKTEVHLSEKDSHLLVLRCN